jgi:hypothetical protein
MPRAAPVTRAPCGLRHPASVRWPVGVAAKEAGQRTMAVEVLVAAVDDGRLLPGDLGEHLAPLLAVGAVKAARLARTLAEAVGAGAAQAQAARVVIEQMLRGDPGRSPRHLAKLLEVLHELLVVAGEAPIRLPARTSTASRPAARRPCFTGGCSPEAPDGAGRRTHGAPARVHPITARLT